MLMRRSFCVMTVVPVASITCRTSIIIAIDRPTAATAFRGGPTTSCGRIARSEVSPSWTFLEVRNQDSPLTLILWWWRTTAAREERQHIGRRRIIRRARKQRKTASNILSSMLLMRCTVQYLSTVMTTRMHNPPESSPSQSFSAIDGMRRSHRSRSALLFLLHLVQ